MIVEPKPQNHAVLFIDDEVQSQKYFSQIFGKIFPVHLASTGEEGLELFLKHRDEIGVVVSDQRMPGMVGSELLAEIAQQNPDVVRILSTAYSDLNAAIDAVNEGGIYRYVTKPWEIAELEITLRRAMEYYQLKERHRTLANIKIAALEQMFHQSRLLASLAIPALLKRQPAVIRAYRDLLRLSVDDHLGGAAPAGTASHDLSQADRQSLAQKFEENLSRLLALMDESPVLTENGQKEIETILASRTPDDHRSVLAQSFTRHLLAEAGEDELRDLAGILAAYENGYEIQKEAGRWALTSRASDESDGSAFEELYALFVDDAFLVGEILSGLDH